MKGSVIFIVLLIISLPFSFARIVDVPKVTKGESLPEEMQESSSIGTKRYIYAGSSLVASQDSSGVMYYHQDRLGSNRVVTDENGEKIGEFLSLPFGKSVVDEVKYGFTGKELDSSGLHYFGARYYDSNLGRFLEVDPVPSEPAYQYVRNNPMNFIDPDGMGPVNTGSNRIALIYPYGYNFAKIDVGMIREALLEEGLGVDIYRFDTLNRKNGVNSDILSFVDKLHESYSEVIITGHGLSLKEEFSTLSPNERGKKVVISWSDYVARSWLHDLSCGSTCEFDPYSSIDISFYLGLVLGYGGEIDENALKLIEEMSRGRSVSETGLLTRDRRHVKKIMEAYYGGETVLSDEYFDSILWGIVRKMELNRNWFSFQEGFDALNSDFRDPVSGISENIGIS